MDGSWQHSGWAPPPGAPSSGRLAVHRGASGLLPDTPRMGPVSGPWQTFRSWSWGRGRTRGPSLEWGPQGEPHTTCPVWPEDVVLGKPPGPRHSNGAHMWRAAQDRLKDWPARWEPRNLHLAPRPLLVVQSGTGTHCKACPADCLEHWKAAPFARWVLGCLACPHPSRLRLCSSQECKKGTQAHSRASGISRMAPHTQGGSGVWGRLAPLPAS